MESKTPRTDSESRLVNHTTYYMGAAFSAKIEVVDADVARRLETELAEARTEIERLKREHVELLIKYDEKFDVIDTKDKLIEQMREALSLFLEGAIHDFHYVCQHRDNCLCWGCQKKRVKAALEAAERGK